MKKYRIMTAEERPVDILGDDIEVDDNGNLYIFRMEYEEGEARVVGVFNYWWACQEICEVEEATNGIL